VQDGTMQSVKAHYSPPKLQHTISPVLPLNIKALGVSEARFIPDLYTSDDGARDRRVVATPPCLASCWSRVTGWCGVGQILTRCWDCVSCLLGVASGAFPAIPHAHATVRCAVVAISVAGCHGDVFGVGGVACGVRHESTAGTPVL